MHSGGDHVRVLLLGPRDRGVGNEAAELSSLRPAPCKNPDGPTHHPLTDEVAMLVLTRKVGEQIVIDGDIRITVSAVKGDRVKIAISAPPQIKVNRAEVAARIAAEAAEDAVLEYACR